MLKGLLLALVLLAAPVAAQTTQPFVIGEWAGDCRADYRVGYRMTPDGRVVAYTVTKGVYADFGTPKVQAESADFFTLDFGDGGPPVIWKKVGETIRPWNQGEGGSIIKDGVRGGNPTPTFQRCR